MYTPFKMKGKSPMMKALIGKQSRLPEHLKAKILAAPESPTKMMKKSPAKAKTEAAKRLLKAVPNQAAYDKLSAIEKKEFNKAAKKAKLPMKNVASALKMKTSPALAKLSSSCKAAAKRKFKVYPSAYANMWASKTQKAGKC